MTNVQEWVWNYATVFCVFLGIILFIISDYVYLKIKKAEHPIFSVVVIFLSATILVSSIWWWLLIPSHVVVGKYKETIIGNDKTISEKDNEIKNLKAQLKGRKTFVERVSYPQTWVVTERGKFVYTGTWEIPSLGTTFHCPLATIYGDETCTVLESKETVTVIRESKSRAIRSVYVGERKGKKITGYRTLHTPPKDWPLDDVQRDVRWEAEIK